MAPTNNHRNYEKLCEDPDLNPLGSGERLEQNLTKIYDHWKVTGDPNTTLDEDQLFVEHLRNNATGMIGGILTFLNATGTSGPRVALIHNVKTHHAITSPHRGSTFAYVGDIEEQDIDLISYDSTLFAEAPIWRVAATPELHAAQLAALPTNNSLVPHPTDNDPTVSKEVGTRKSMFVQSELC